jgi:ectoine hydroxylase-related dioxygenase (phytanoyl-CoA dioxygenase family)
VHIPDLTRDFEMAHVDFKRHGVALIADALAPAELAAARNRLAEQAESERRDGTALLEDGSASDGHYLTGRGQPNQRVMSLISKGEVFRRIAEKPEPLAFVRRVFAESYGSPEETVFQYELDDVLVSSVSANIAGRGGLPMNLHADQGFVPNATPYPIIVNALYLLCNFNGENGGTRIAPGTHDSLRHGGYYAEPPQTMPIIAPAGTLLMFDGRTWHGTGANVTDEPRYALLTTYCRPWIRQFENFGLSLDDATLAACSPTLRRLLGFKVWSVYGRAEMARLDSEHVI